MSTRDLLGLTALLTALVAGCGSAPEVCSEEMVDGRFIRTCEEDIGQSSSKLEIVAYECGKACNGPCPFVDIRECEWERTRTCIDGCCTTPDGHGDCDKAQPSERCEDICDEVLEAAEEEP